MEHTKAEFGLLVILADFHAVVKFRMGVLFRVVFERCVDVVLKLRAFFITVLNI